LRISGEYIRNGLRSSKNNSPSVDAESNGKASPLPPRQMTPDSLGERPRASTGRYKKSDFDVSLDDNLLNKMHQKESPVLPKKISNSMDAEGKKNWFGKKIY